MFLLSCFFFFAEGRERRRLGFIRCGDGGSRWVGTILLQGRKTPGKGNVSYALTKATTQDLFYLLLDGDEAFCFVFSSRLSF